jgi:hypothetical protein
MKTSVFWHIAARIAVKVNRRFGGTLLATCFTLFSSVAYFSTLKMKATCRSLTLVDFQRTTRHYIPEYRILSRIREAAEQVATNMLQRVWQRLGTCRDTNVEHVEEN